MLLILWKSHVYLPMLLLPQAHCALRETSIPGEVNGIQHYVIKFTVKNGSSVDFFSVLTLFPPLMN